MKYYKSTVFRYSIFLLVVFTTFCFLFLIKKVLYSFLLAAIIAYILYRPVKAIEKKGLKKALAILLVYLVLFLITFGVIWIAAPHLENELSKLAGILPQYIDRLQDFSNRLNRLEIPEEFRLILSNNLERTQNLIYGSLNGIVEGIYKFFGQIFIIILAPVLAFYILNEWEKIKEVFLSLFSPGARRDLCMLALDIDNVIIEYLKGYLLVSFIVGISIGVIAAIIGVKFAFIIGILSGIANLVPYFGPFLGAIPAVFLALSQSSLDAVYMLVAIIIVQQIDSNFITPKIIGDKLGMDPLLIVFALLAGGELLGIWGMLIAVPFTAALKIVIKYLYLKMVE